MNSTDRVVVLRLIADLDDTRLLYTRLAPLLIRPHLKFLVEGMATSHGAIADHLAAQVDPPGAARGAGMLGRVRVGVERWIAITNLDIELGCLKCVARHEARVARRLREALESIRSLPQGLHRELSRLERSLFRIESLMREMERPMAAMPRPRAAVMRFPNEERFRS